MEWVVGSCALFSPEDNRLRGGCSASHSSVIKERIKQQLRCVPLGKRHVPRDTPGSGDLVSRVRAGLMPVMCFLFALFYPPPTANGALL